MLISELEWIEHQGGMRLARPAETIYPHIWAYPDGTFWWVNWYSGVSVNNIGPLELQALLFDYFDKNPK